MSKLVEILSLFSFILCFSGCSDDKKGEETGQDCPNGQHWEMKSIDEFVCVPDGQSLCDSLDCSQIVENWAHGYCLYGLCFVQECVDGFHVSNSKCVPDSTDACGSSATSCKGAIAYWKDGVCEHGQCFVTQCAPGFHVENNGCVKDPTICDGVEVDPSTDNQHCGECHHACTDGRLCVSGQCRYTEASTIVCNGISVNPGTDSANCGGCGNICGYYKRCENGECSRTDNIAQCNGVEVDYETDAQNCGSCEH